MARVTAEELAGIIEVDASISTTPFITAANALVTELCVPKGYDAERLELIELWLSAHLYAQRDAQSQSESAGGVSASYQGQTAMHLDNTRWGQTAMLLDTQGALAALNKQTSDGVRAVASLTWLGKRKSEQIDYEDRD